MVLDEICTYLAAQGLGLTAGTNLFYGKMLDMYPNAVTIVYLWGGHPDEPNTGGVGSGTLTRLEFPFIQIVCRGEKNDYTTPDTLARNIRAKLMLIENQNLGSVAYKAVEPQQPPFFLKTDDNFRNYIACNYHVMKAVS